MGRVAAAHSRQSHQAQPPSRQSRQTQSHRQPQTLVHICRHQASVCATFREADFSGLAVVKANFRAARSCVETG